MAVALYLALVALTALLAYLAHRHPVFPGDRSLARWVQGLDSEPLRRALEAVSALGDWWPIVLPPLAALALLLQYRRWRDSMYVAVAMLAEPINQVLKLLVDRPRPEGWVASTSSSFPSGHAAHSLLFYGFLLYLATALVRPLWPRRGLQVALVMLILATGVSRVYLGAHWPSDVLGGYLVGAVMLIPLVWAHQRWRR